MVHLRYNCLTRLFRLIIYNLARCPLCHLLACLTLTSSALSIKSRLAVCHRWAPFVFSTLEVGRSRFNIVHEDFGVEEVPKSRPGMTNSTRGGQEVMWRKQQTSHGPCSVPPNVHVYRASQNIILPRNKVFVDVISLSHTRSGWALNLMTVSSEEEEKTHRDTGRGLWEDRDRAWVSHPQSKGRPRLPGATRSKERFFPRALDGGVALQTLRFWTSSL